MCFNGPAARGLNDGAFPFRFHVFVCYCLALTSRRAERFNYGGLLPYCLKYGTSSLRLRAAMAGSLGHYQDWWHCGELPVSSLACLRATTVGVPPFVRWHVSTMCVCVLGVEFWRPTRGWHKTFLLLVLAKTIFSCSYPAPTERKGLVGKVWRIMFPFAWENVGEMETVYFSDARDTIEQSLINLP